MHILDIKRQAEGMAFDQTMDLQAEVQERNPEVLSLSPVHAQGQVRYEAGLFFLDYHLSYQIGLASSRSMEEVQVNESFEVNELFAESQEAATNQDLIDAELVLPIEGDRIDLRESLVDNILLHIPIKVLTPAELEEEDLPHGANWSLLTEEQHDQLAQEKKEASNPFASLSTMFDESETD